MERPASPVISPAGEKLEGGGSLTHSPARGCPTFARFSKRGISPIPSP